MKADVKKPFVPEFPQLCGPVPSSARARASCAKKFPGTYATVPSLFLHTHGGIAPCPNTTTMMNEAQYLKIAQVDVQGRHREIKTIGTMRLKVVVPHRKRARTFQWSMSRLAQLESSLPPK
jgi:hypothetical protein